MPEQRDPYKPRVYDVRGNEILVGARTVDGGVIEFISDVDMDGVYVTVRYEKEVPPTEDWPARQTWMDSDWFADEIEVVQ